MAKILCQRRRVALTLSIALFGACDDGGSAAQVDADGAGVDAAEVDAEPTPDSDPAPDLGVLDGGGDAAAPVACVADPDCGEAAYCEAGVCVASPPGPFYVPVVDGVTRAAAGAFDITPAYLERWTDRAGPDCPDNRPDHFDGALVASPDPCLDAFEDADEDGVFDAVWLGGGADARPATGVDNENPPAGRVLVLARDDVLRVLVTLDVHALDAARVEDLQRRLARRLGIPSGLVAVHATGGWHGPDAVGMSGPHADVGGGPDAFFARAAGVELFAALPWRSGVDEAWWAQVCERAATAVRATNPVPIVTRHAAFAVPIGPAVGGGEFLVPDSDEDGLLNDAEDLAAYRREGGPFAHDVSLPGRRDPRGYAVALEGRATGEPVAVLVGWGVVDAHITATAGRLSGGLPGAVRAALEAEHPGATALWLTSAGADTLRLDERAWVPRTSAAGQMLDAEDRVVESARDAALAEDPVAATSRFISQAAIRALAAADETRVEMTARSRFAWVPLRNPLFGVAARLGLLRPLGGWLSGRTVTAAWSSGTTTPPCGGLGCLRYRMERISLGRLVIVTTPGALEGGYVRGREETLIPYAGRRELLDLDRDGVPDGSDPEIATHARVGGRESMVTLAGPANPQRIPAVEGLAADLVWIVGRTNGGVGTLRAPAATPNVFEGMAESLVAFVQDPENAAINVCTAGFSCSGDLTVGELTQRTIDAQPEVLADLVGVHELRLSEAAFGAEIERLVDGWRIEGPEGEVRAAGGPLELGPRDRAYVPEHDLLAAGVTPGDRLVVEGEPERAWAISGRVALELARHPNAADIAASDSPDGGDLVYNVACELVFDGGCPNRRAVFGADPNLTLPRAP